MDTDLRKNIIRLIQTRREGDYWDFKQQFHTNRADLLHDILCLANNRANRDGYLIIGVTNGDCKIVGVEKDENRRNQQQVIDFLRSKKFAGDNRPKIELHTFFLEKHEIDVLVMFDTLDTPYYLSEDYSDTGRIVKANAIYTRVGDTNTPIDRSADYAHVEYLWKKRLGLHLSPFQRLSWLLEDKNNWQKSEDNHYNTLHPEFTITFEDLMEGNPTYFSYIMLNELTTYGIVRVHYYGTVLYSCRYTNLDKGHYMTTLPMQQTVFLEAGHTFSYVYFIHNEIPWLLHQYMLNENNFRSSANSKRFLEVVCVFYSRKEKKRFEKYIRKHRQETSVLIAQYSKKHQWRFAHTLEPARTEMIRDIATGFAFNAMLQQFHSKKEDPLSKP